MMDDKETKLDKQVVTTQITDDQGDSQVHSVLMCETGVRISVISRGTEDRQPGCPAEFWHA